MGPLSTARVRKPSARPRAALDPVESLIFYDEPDRSTVRRPRERAILLELILSATGVPRSVPEVGIPAGERATIPFSRAPTLHPPEG
ncbi:hypothetical protein CH282_22620 [Rhodococcus sp. 06-418-1B]|nr:hypothetical protein CH282_22620 [Rhodococcus sp. 06-418-1B]